MKGIKGLLLVFALLLSFTSISYAQEEEFSNALDSARAAEDNKKDSVIFTARYVRYTNLQTL